MAASDRPYSRVYHEILTDPKFEGIFRDDGTLAAWLRLLIAAEQAWPLPAMIPRSVDQLVLNTLVDHDLVVYAGNGDTFRIKGLDAERNRRAEAGRAGGLASGRSRSVQPPSNDRSTTVEPTPNEIERERERVLEREGTYVETVGQRAPAPKGWEDYDRPEWDPFRMAWCARGFRLPPTGRRDDTTKNQRAILWEIARDHPLALGRWVGEAPKGANTHMLVGYVIERYRSMQAGL
jgi:hypothetical protein